MEVTMEDKTEAPFREEKARKKTGRKAENSRVIPHVDCSTLTSTRESLTRLWEAYLAGVVSEREQRVGVYTCRALGGLFVSERVGRMEEKVEMILKWIAKQEDAATLRRHA
jgi:hypothetical protein